MLRVLQIDRGEGSVGKDPFTGEVVPLQGVGKVVLTEGDLRR
jgi:hypothetical protein